MWLRENQAVIAAFVMTAPTWGLLWYNIWLAHRNHGLLNSVMHERLAEQQRMGHAEGELAGEANARDRTEATEPRKEKNR